MSSESAIQRNRYKGSPERAWVHLQFIDADGSRHVRELLADTGSPCAIILGQTDLSRFLRAAGTDVQSNFGQLTGGWLEFKVPELELTTQLLGFGSDRVLQAVQAASSDFAGLVGLPLLRLVEYGGNGEQFWLRGRAAIP